MFSFLHLATLDGAGEGPSAAFWPDAAEPESAQLAGAYVELFAIQKSCSFIEPTLPSHRHAGYIVSSFKILDSSCRVRRGRSSPDPPVQQRQLEKTWLGWTGAREIYKYAPRTWNLRRITLLRVCSLA